MFEMFDKKKSYILPSGKTISGSELTPENGYLLTSFDDCIVDVVAGTINSFARLAKLCEDNGINYVDNSSLVELNRVLNDKKNANKISNASAVSMLAATKIVAQTFTDEQAIEVPDLYPEYEVNHEYKQGDRFQYNRSLFKVNQDHTSAAQWVPGTSGTESLYTNLMLDESGYQIWKQPTGAHDAYNTGDIVRYPDKDGQLYKSTIDGNVWAPDAYPQGWEVYTEE